MALEHRLKGYALLQGQGMEIGAFHQPAPLPAHCRACYCDALSKAEAAELFSELDGSQLVEVEHICDLDRERLARFADAGFDFVIFNHVIEHLANPIASLGELFRVIRPGGLAVISAPDKHFTFDSPRNITPFEHLLDEYRAGVTEVTDAHYIDFIEAAHPEFLELDEQAFSEALEQVRRRREHAHVWDSAAFQAFLMQSLRLLHIDATRLYESTGEENRFEYFSVWRKAEAKPTTPARIVSGLKRLWSRK